jgi:NAD(P)-dependent dehydrogenase (short-subunit alcohol dehydrogenase family)
MRAVELPTSEQTAVVTGGASGLGAGAVAALVARGMRVYTFDIAAASQSESIRGVTALSVDVRDPEAVEEAAQTVLQEAGRIDVLVNSHGVLQKFATLAETDDAELHRVMSINFDGVVVTCRVAGRIMADQNYGRIINIASDAGRVPVPLLAIYCASKGAVISLSQALALELGPLGITVNAICPGVMRTPMSEAAADVRAARGSRSREDLLIAKAESLPVRRLGTPGDLGDAVAWLASPESGFVTGALINITGGENFF